MSSPFIVALVMGPADHLLTLTVRSVPLVTESGREMAPFRLNPSCWAPFPGGAPGDKVICAGCELVASRDAR